MELAENVRPRLRAEQYVMFFVGGLLLASGLFHLLVWISQGGTLAGPVSWRKPILFGFSAGVTVLSLGWVTGKWKRVRGDLVLLTAFSLAMFVEVGLITMQQWRGVPSHFNRSTPFDAAVLSGIEWLIVFVTLVIAELTRRSFQPLRAPRDMALAIQSGMTLLLFSCLLGFVLVLHGNQQIALGKPPEVYGKSGVMKFPHGVPMHAIQFLPIGAWLLQKLRVPEGTRVWAVSSLLASLLVFTVFSLVQTFTGRARFDWSWHSTPLLIISVIFLLAPLFFALSHAVAAWRRRIRIPLAGDDARMV